LVISIVLKHLAAEPPHKALRGSFVCHELARYGPVGSRLVYRAPLSARFFFALSYFEALASRTPIAVAGFGFVTFARCCFRALRA
jgi:hypothetical protein